MNSWAGGALMGISIPPAAQVASSGSASTNNAYAVEGSPLKTVATSHAQASWRGAKRVRPREVRACASDMAYRA
jgi:hypothetical protein